MSDAATSTSEPGLKGEVVTIEPDRSERGLARRSAESRATVPAMELGAVAAVDALLERVGELGCGLAASVIAAASSALRAVPRVNGSYRDGRFELYSRVNVGVTLVDASAHVTPTLFDADAKPVAEIDQELAGYHARVRDDALRPFELSGATFTVIDSSAYDVTVMPMVLPPQAGALACGPVREVPVVRDGKIVPGRTMQLSLAVDSRIVHGNDAAAFLAEVKAFLEEARV